MDMFLMYLLWDPLFDDHASTTEFIFRLHVEFFWDRGPTYFTGCLLIFSLCDYLSFLSTVFLGAEKDWFDCH